MAKKISDLPASAALTGGTLLEVSREVSPGVYSSEKATLADIAAFAGAGEQPFTLVAGWNGKPLASSVLMRAPIPIDASFAINLAGSRAIAEVAATASTVFDIKKNGVSVGTLTFAVGGTVGTFTAASAFTVAPGDILKIVAPATPDATLADLGITLLGAR